MKQPFVEDDEEMNGDASGRGLLQGNQTNYDNNKDEGFPYCGCLSVKYYQPYFDVDTTDIISRVRKSTVYCGQEGQFIDEIDEKPDLYGPFWVSDR
jgi:hypothetical protein